MHKYMSNTWNSGKCTGRAVHVLSTVCKEYVAGKQQAGYPTACSNGLTTESLQPSLGAGRRNGGASWG